MTWCLVGHYNIPGPSIVTLLKAEPLVRYTFCIRALSEVYRSLLRKLERLLQNAAAIWLYLPGTSFLLVTCALELFCMWCVCRSQSPSSSSPELAQVLSYGSLCPALAPKACSAQLYLKLQHQDLAICRLVSNGIVFGVECPCHCDCDCEGLPE